MTLRAIQEIIIHLESFRNIQLWYQGLYFLKIQVFQQKKHQIVYAHPYAHTENYHPYQQSRRYYDAQILKTASIQDQTSTFLSKFFMLKYFEEEVDINDICHFRIQTDLNQTQVDLTIRISLMFFDCVTKKHQKPQMAALSEAKNVKTKNYHLIMSRKGIHQFFPVIFQDQYFSLLNMCIHSICLDYRFRINKIQLYQFSKLTYQQKMKMIQNNKKKQIQQISYYQNILKDLNLQDKKQSLQKIDIILINQMKKNYYSLQHIYSAMFAKIITDYQKRVFSSQLIQPNNLNLFQEEGLLFRNGDDKIYEKYKSKNHQEIIQKMLNQVNAISVQLTKLWHAYLDLFKINPRFCFALLQQQYQNKQRQFWQKLVIKNHFRVKDLAIGANTNQQSQQQFLLQQKLKIKPTTSIYDDDLLSKRQNLPILVSNIYELQIETQNKQRLSMKNYNQNNNDDDGIHLIVFVHGFQGSSFDMRLIKNYISYLYPQSMFLCSSANQQMTDNDIFQMGARLAMEIKNYILENLPNQTLGRISFVGYSVGGVKIRAALPKLLEYKDKFHTFITFSSAHLGYGINTSSVIQAGIWFLQKMKSSECLKQLSMADHQIPQQTCMYKLSEEKGLQYFKNIFLFSSKQDSYAPYQSARIQIPPSFLNDKNKKLHCRMVRNILNNISSGILRRVNVSFKISQKNIDSLIGRTAHIMFLESHELMKALLFTEPNLFS